jgi:hypothetical protein
MEQFSLGKLALADIDSGRSGRRSARHGHDGLGQQDAA